MNIDAYDLFLQGWAHYHRETPEGYSDAIPFLKGAIELDPSFHRPHAVLAAIYYLGRLRRWYPQWGLTSHETFRRAYQHLERANRAPSPLGLSVSALMHIHNGRHEQALADAEAATALDANDATAQIVLAHALSVSGRADEAIERVEQAMRLNPHFPASYDWTLGLAHFVAGDYEAARRDFERAGTAHSGLDLSPMLATYGHLDRTADAQRILELQRTRWRKWHPGHPMTARSLAADIPPLVREADRSRLLDGLTKAMAPPVPP